MPFLDLASLGMRLDSGVCVVCGANAYTSGSCHPLHLQKVAGHGSCMLCDDCFEEFTDGDMVAAFDEAFPSVSSVLDDDEDDIDEYDGVDEI